MKIQFKKECEIEVIENLDENEKVQSHLEIFAPGETLDVENFQEGNAWGFQFGDGSVIFIPEDSFNVIPE